MRSVHDGLIARGLKSRIGTLVVLAGVVVLTATTSLAQPGGGGGRGGPGGGGGMRGMMGDLFSSPVSPREIDVFTQVAGLTTDQKEAAKTLLDGYQEQFRVKSSKMQKEMEKAREKAQETRDFSAFEQIRGSMQTFRTERKEMEEQFFGDFKAILTPEQVERWPLIERAHRRSRTMSRGMISGERVDLVQIIESSKFPVEVQATVIPTLGEYEEALDRELVNRNKVYDEVADAFGPNADPAKTQDLLSKGKDASMRVREVNRRFSRQISDMLPQDYKAPFDDAVKRASYPDVYRTTQTESQLTAASNFTDLDATQKESLTALQTSHNRTLAALNEKIAAATTEREEKFDPRQFAQRGFGGRGGQQGRNGGNDASDPVGTLRREKRDLDEATLTSLKKILTPAQIERLPEEDRDRGDRGGEQRRGATNREI